MDPQIQPQNAPMIQKPWLFWIVGIVLLGLMIYLLRDVMLPFVAAFAVAYLLDPLARKLERLGSSRLVATVFIIGIFIVLFTFVLLTVVPLLANQMAALVERIPDYATRLLQALLEQGICRSRRPRFGGSLEKLGLGGGRADFQNWASEIASQGGTWALWLLKSLVTGGQAVIGLTSLLVVTPVVAFYLLADCGPDDHGGSR